MPAQSSISNLLSLSPSAQPAKARPSRDDDSFRRLLEQPGPSARAERPPETTREREPARVKDAHAGASDDRRSDRRELSSEGRRTDSSRQEEVTPTPAEQRASRKEQTSAADATNESAEVESAEGVAENASIEEAKALLENLSEEDWAKLSDDVKAVLAELKAQVDAGTLDPALEETLQQLLANLENGASLDAIAQQLEAIPLDALPGLAARFPEAQTLRDALGKRGAAHLSQLSALAQADPNGQRQGGVNAQFNPGGVSEPEGLDLSALLEAGKTGARSSREEFGLLLQNLARGQGEQAKPVDLGASGTSVSALAQLDNGARAQPVTPAERQFTVQSDVRVPVGQGQWGQAVGQKVLWMASQKISSAELRLDPPDLGPMQVRVSTHQDQISVTFTSPQSAVREALDQNANRLREMFAEQGLDLVDVNVSDQSGRESMAGEGDGRRGGGRSGGGDEEAEGQPAQWIVSERLVDHYA
ncbi:flagellar hook-length control protein FliK [Marinimicrobium agarilyticum]|uniref:flagellar hook-length control protein FliK n=1 Tax=Marinimicrobium agarilyticum TaxID=306546 RepID=UPI00041CAE68|nr:flagellar hook-length control protein FliK [Marinimicrobium agarilyticum]